MSELTKYEVLKALSVIRETGWCNMFDIPCIMRALMIMEREDIVFYLESLPSKVLHDLIYRDFAKYLKGKLDDETELE
jgi:hypothetical protein